MDLVESAPLTEAAPTAPPGVNRYHARLIEGDRQGTSGYYPASMLKECAGVFAAGTPMYLDHPGLSESVERPERSVRDLAGYLASDAVYEGDGLYADVEVYPHVAPVVEAIWKNTGLSIRAAGTVEPSTSESIRGPVVTALTEATSVDYVTAAGAGGKIVELLESARAAVAEAATVSDKPWADFKAADYSIEQYRKACLIGPDSPSENKGDYSLPVREPNGTLNRNGVHAAASALAGGHGGVKATAAQKRTAAQSLVRLYGQLGEDPPAAVANLAGKPKGADGGGKSGNTAKESAAQTEWAVKYLAERYGADVPLSEARNIGAWLEARIHSIFTNITDDMYGDGRMSRDERMTLSSAIGDALTTFTSAVEKDAPQLYQRDLWDGPDEGGSSSMQETAQEVRPGARPADKEESLMAGSGAPTGGTENMTDEEKRKKAEQDAAKAKESAVTEAATQRERELATQLAEAQKAHTETVSRVEALESRLAESDARNLRLENEQAARKAVAEALKGSGLPEFAHDRLTEGVCRDLPLDEDKRLDATKFAEAVKAAIEAEQAYLTQMAEAAGVGRPRGLGATTDTGARDLDAELAEAFGRMGMSESDAKIAATGR